MKALLWVLVVLLCLVGCGVPVQNDPVPVQPGAVPSQLQETGPTGPPPASTVPGRSSLQINFVRNDQLVSLRRPAPDSDRLQAVLDDLIAGPTELEQANGVTTALPPNATLSIANVDDSHVTLELSGDTEGRSATENVLAVGQIVLSVTALPTVDSVTFARNGVPVEALLADGALTTQPLTAADYQSLKAR
jgi:spore germination protein GerM